MGTSVKVVIGTVIICLLCGVLLFKYQSRGSDQVAIYNLERDRECKARAAQSAPDEESKSFVRVDDMFYSPKLNACVWAVANSSLGTDPENGRKVGNTWVSVQNRDLNNDLVTLETADFYETKEDLRVFLNTKTAEFR